MALTSRHDVRGLHKLGSHLVSLMVMCQRKGVVARPGISVALARSYAAVGVTQGNKARAGAAMMMGAEGIIWNQSQ